MTPEDHALLNEISAALKRNAAYKAVWIEDLRRAEAALSALESADIAQAKARVELVSLARSTMLGEPPPFTAEAIDRLLGGE